MKASFEPHYSQVFVFADDTEAVGCCCFWRSRPASREVHIGKDLRVRKVRSLGLNERIETKKRFDTMGILRVSRDLANRPQEVERTINPKALWAIIKNKAKVPESPNSPLQVKHVQACATAIMGLTQR